jgi:hypothetical protein
VWTYNKLTEEGREFCHIDIDVILKKKILFKRGITVQNPETLVTHGGYRVWADIFSKAPSNISMRKTNAPTINGSFKMRIY